MADDPKPDPKPAGDSGTAGGHQSSAQQGKQSTMADPKAEVAPRLVKYNESDMPVGWSPNDPNELA
ncbi:MAG: hypothetical protein ACJ8F7_07015 [Gemmataceae bacterium]